MKTRFGMVLFIGIVTLMMACAESDNVPTGDLKGTDTNGTDTNTGDAANDDANDADTYNDGNTDEGTIDTDTIDTDTPDTIGTDTIGTDADVSDDMVGDTTDAGTDEGKYSTECDGEQVLFCLNDDEKDCGCVDPEFENLLKDFRENSYDPDNNTLDLGKWERIVDGKPTSEDQFNAEIIHISNFLNGSFKYFCPTETDFLLRQFAQPAICLNDDLHLSLNPCDDTDTCDENKKKVTSGDFSMSDNKYYVNFEVCNPITGSRCYTLNYSTID